MDRRLQIVERLYSDGGGNHEESPAHPEQAEDLAPEFHAMSQAKFWMDHRRRVRPEPATIDRIVEAAAAASRGTVPGVVRPDRSPLRLVASPRFRMAVAATLVALVASLGIWRSTLPPQEQQQLAARQEAEVQEEPSPRPADERKAVAPSLADADLAANEAFRPGGKDDSALFAGREGLRAAAAQRAPATEWDDSEDVVRLHQRIDRLRLRQADDGWDKPVVPLEMMPSDSRAAGIYQAGSRKD